MSVYFNQTNISPGTPFSGGGGGGGVATSLQIIPLIPANPTLSDSIIASFTPYSQDNILGVYNSITNNLAPLQIGGALEVQDGGNQTSTALWRTQYGAQSIVFEAQDSGTSFPYLAINRAASGGESFSGVALTNISTINGAVPGGGGGGLKIQYGIFGLSNTGQTVTYPEAFKTNPSVFITPSGLDGIGFFVVGNSNTTDFQVSYSGELVSVPVDVNWLAVGT